MRIFRQRAWLLSTHSVVLVAMLLAYARPTLTADDSLVDIELGPATFAVPQDWIDPGWRDASQAGAADTIYADTILLAPPLAALAAASDGAFDPESVASVAILLRDDPDLEWRAHYVDGRIAAAEERFGIATADDAAIAFDDLPFDRLYGGAFASAGKSASRALHFGGSIPTSAHDTVAVAARIDTSTRLYSMSLTIRAGEEPIAAVITLRTTRPLNAGDFALVGVAIEIANGTLTD